MENNFKGEVKMYNEVYFIDTETGQGFDKVLKKIDPLLCKMASKTFLPGCAFEDVKQELQIMAIKGIRNYNPEMGTALSTFLHGHLTKKLISRLKHENKLARNADFLHHEVDLSANPKSIRKIKHEMVASSMIRESDANYADSGVDHVFESKEFKLFDSNFRDHNSVNFETAIRSAIKNADPKTKRIVELVALYDYSVKDAADEVGLTNWAASLRLRRLAGNKIIREILGKKKIDAEESLQ